MQSAKFLVIGDLHIHLDNLEETEILAAFLVRTAQEVNPDVIVVLGDILHTNNILRSEAHGPATDLLGELSDVAPLLVLMGNHDVPGPLSFLSGQHGFRYLKRWMGTPREHVQFPNGRGVQLVDTEPVIFSVHGLRFCACPYTPPGRFEEALDHCEDWRSTVALFCHQELAACDLGHGLLSSSKDIWSADYPQIVSGHIHKYQRIEENILYGGSPRQVAIDEDTYKTIATLVFAERVSKDLGAARDSNKVPNTGVVQDPILTVDAGAAPEVVVEQVSSEVQERINDQKPVEIQERIEESSAAIQETPKPKKYFYTETRISTELAPRMHIKIQTSEINTVEVPESGRIKIEITGTVAENTVAKKSQRVKDWKRKKFRVVFHDLLGIDYSLDDAKEDENLKIGFKGLCRLRAAEEGLQAEYAEIFG